MRKPDPKTKDPKASAKSKTVFHPGVMHNHQPSGRWADVQQNPRSDEPMAFACRHMDPAEVLAAASVAELSDKKLAFEHLRWYLGAGGADFVEDANLESMLRTDAGVQARIAAKIPSGRSSGTFTGHLKIEQRHYADDDFQFAFGAIDRLDFVVDFGAGTLHAWFQDRYEWHPVYPFYKAKSGDSPRPTNCVHAAAVELKRSGAQDYWMKGEATIPLDALKSPASRSHEPAIPGAPPL
jgi:hypothetical protein